MFQRIKRCLHKRIVKDCLICAGIVFLIVLLFAAGLLDTQKVWPDVPLDLFEGKRAFSLESGDSYGTVASGPYYSLPAGRYRIRWQITGDGENAIRLSCSNGAQITPALIKVVPDRWEDEAYFEIEEAAHSFSINIDFLSGTAIEVHNIRLYSPMYRDQTFTAMFILIAICVLAGMRIHGKLTPEGMKETALLGIAVLLVSYPCLQADSFLAWDTQFHAARIMNLADALSAGQIPARVGGFSYNGYGAATSVFYPDLLLYPWALMSMAGASMSYIINTLVIAVNILTAACMYAAGRRLLENRMQAVCASLIYLFSTYRLGDLYTRLMVGEMLAMAFLPLFLLGVAEVTIGDRKRWPVLALAATLICRSHLLTTVLCALAAFVFCLVYAGKIFREGRYREITLAIAAAVALNISQFLPMLQMHMAGVTTSVMQFGFADSALTVSELFAPDGYIGMVVLLGAAVYLATLQDERDSYCLGYVLFFAGAVCMILSTELIPWRHVVLLTGGLVEVFQFPMRFLVVGSLCLAMCGGIGFAKLWGQRSMQAAVIILAVGMATVLPLIKQMPPYTEAFEFGQGAKAHMVYPEYQYEGTDFEGTRSREVISEGDVQVTEYRKSGTRICARVEAETDGEVVFPLFGFDGYAVELEGERRNWTLGDNNRLTVCVPAGTNGELRVWYEGKMIWRILDVISLVTAMGITRYWFARRGKGKCYAAEK